MDKNLDGFSWFEYADNDFEAVTILAAQFVPKYEIVCYHCQQCAEKMLKGYIASNNGRLLKTHDLVVLCENCARFDLDFENIIDQCSDLTIFASEVRYPNMLEIDSAHMRKAIENASEIRAFVLDKLTGK